MPNNEKEISKKSISTLCLNAKIASKAWESLTPEERIDLLPCFHLRPTTNGITIVSTLQYSPMRGIENNENLEFQLKKLHSALLDLKNAKDDTMLKNNFGFKARKNTQKMLEENIQAMFIQGMVKKEDQEDQYEGITFLASELRLEKSNKFDVLGIKDNVLYVFELKRGRELIGENGEKSQLEIYKNFLEDNLETLKEVTINYPNFIDVDFRNLDKLETVKGVYVMQYSASQHKDVIKNIVDKGFSIWLYEQKDDDISFENKYPCK